MASDGWNIYSQNTGIVFECKNLATSNPSPLTFSSSVLQIQPSVEFDVIGCNVGIGKTNPQEIVDVLGDVNLSSANSYKINGTDILSSTTLSNVTGSQLTSLGTLGSLIVSQDLTVNGGTLKVNSTTNRVGFGTTDPQTYLHIYGNDNTARIIGSTTSWIAFNAREATAPGVRSGYIGYGSPTDTLLYVTAEIPGGWLSMRTRASGGATNYLTITDNPYLGIGTSSVSYPVVIAGSSSTDITPVSWFDQSVSTIQTSDLTSEPISLYSENGSIWTSLKFVASSDARIKKNIAAINDGEALEKLRLLNPVTYTYVDTIQRSTAPVYGFIAQEVKEVLPYAVSHQRDVIPSVFSTGVAESSYITTSKPHNLNPGDRVRVIKQDNTNPSGDMYEVSTVMTEFSFQLYNFSFNGNVFVYGKEVNDFNVLDKNAVFTVNVSATQELDREIQTLLSDINNLESKISQLEILVN